MSIPASPRRAALGILVLALAAGCASSPTDDEPSTPYAGPIGAGEGAVNVLYRKELESATDPTAERAKRVAEFREKFANPFIAAANGFVDEVIQPRTTRRKLIMALATLTTKREKNPPKKHGNIPL